MEAFTQILGGASLFDEWDFYESTCTMYLLWTKWNKQKDTSSTSL